ncbi:PhnD/SsuA/transferrin family substrate-binding protein [Magnetococcales bacterium HHB-1]
MISNRLQTTTPYPSKLCRKWPLFLLFTLSLLISPPTHSKEKTLLFGVHPFSPPTTLYDKFSPLIQHLSQAINKPIQLHIAPSYQKHIEEVGHDQVDIFFLGPVPYVKVVEQYGNKEILSQLETDGKTTFQGVIIIRESSPFETS